MKERPILMNAPMVQALLAGRKTQRRRIMKREIQGEFCNYLGNPVADPPMHLCPYGKPGDRLWVKETWTGCWHGPKPQGMHIHFAADGGEGMKIAPEGYVLPKAAIKVGSWVTPRFMPRWASRITLEITEVRVQRLQNISERDAAAEGIEGPYTFDLMVCGGPLASLVFRNVWESINGEGSWDANPWVWAVSFQVIQPNIKKVEEAE